jgi:hypothetical protein
MIRFDPPRPPPPPPPKPKPVVHTPAPKRERRSSSFHAHVKPKVVLHPAPPKRAANPAQAVANVQKARKAYEGSKGKVDKLNGRLAGELQKLSPALTAEQKQAYVKSFHDKYAKDYAAEQTGAKQLGDAITDPMLDKAVARDPIAAYAAADGAKALAGSSRSADALRWAAHAFDPANPACANYRKVEQPLREGVATVHDGIDVKKDIVEPSLTNAAGQLVAQNNGDVHAALAQYKSLVENVAGVGLGGKGVGDGLKLLDKVGKAVESGNWTSLEARAFVNAGEAGPAAKGLAGAGLAFAALGVKTAADQGNYAQLAQSVATTGRAGVELLSKTVGALNTAGHIAGTDGLRAATTLDRLAPGIGTVANAIALGIDAGKFANDPSVGAGVSVLGDSIALVGSGVGTVIPGAGQLIEGAGIAISAFGQLITGDSAKHQIDAEEQQLLDRSNVDPGAAKALANGDDQPARLSGKLGMTPEQIQLLAKDHAELFQAPGYTQGLIDVARAAGIKPQDVNGFTDALAKDNGDYVDRLIAFQSTKRSDFPDAFYDSQLRAQLQGQFPSAYAFAKGASPDTFNATGQTRQQAARDVQLASETGLGADPGAIGNLLKQHSSPIYQAAVIGQLKAQGRLDFFARQMGSQYHFNGWPEAARAAITRAEAQGVLAPSETQTLLQQIR